MAEFLNQSITWFCVRSASAGRFAASLCVRVDDPPAGLTRPLVLDPHELVVQGQVVADGILKQKDLLILVL